MISHAHRRVRCSVPLAAACCALVVAIPAAAALYKWVDASGRVVYSDIPPTGDVKYETVSGTAPPATTSNAIKEMAARDAEFRKRQAEAAAKDKQAEDKRLDTAKLNEQCERARLQIKQLAAEQIPYARLNEKGEMVYLDDTARRREREETERWMQTNCKA